MNPMVRSARRKAFLQKRGRLATSPTARLSTLLLLAAAYFGSSRDFGAFLLSIPILAGLLLATIVATVTAPINRFERLRLITAATFVCLAPLAYLYSYRPVQQVRFLLWAPTHYRQLEKASKNNGIVLGWESWGMAGQDTFSYLVVDTEDRLGSKDRADQWTKQIGQSCGFWEQQRVWPKFYIVTTYTNCPYDRIQPAN